MQKHKLLAHSSWLIVIALIVLAGCMKREIKNVNSNGKNIICFGDSITYGYGVKPEEGFCPILSKMVTMPVINAGIDGDTSTEALRRFKADVLDRQPYLVIIEFGGNDFLRKTPMEVTVSNIQQMVSAAQEQGAIVAIADISAGLFLREYRVALSKLAAKNNAIFIPSILSKIITNPALKSDFMHPNSEGYKIVASKIHRYIKPYLKNNNF